MIFTLAYEITSRTSITAISMKNIPISTAIPNVFKKDRYVGNTSTFEAR